jgi:hypothetical protein
VDDATIIAIIAIIPATVAAIGSMFLAWLNYKQAIQIHEKVEVLDAHVKNGNGKEGV